MANTYSSNLRLIIQTTGENAGVWGTYTNTNIATLLEQAITGIGAIAVSGSSNYTLSTANGASDESRNAILNVTGTLTAVINIVCPTVSKTYIIKNGTTGGYAVTLKTSAGTGISVPNGSTMFLYCDGTNVVEAVNYQTTGKFSSLTDTGLTSGRVTYAGTGGLLQDSTNLTFDGTTLSAGGLAGPLNGTVGATTPAAGSFTTLSASSTLTLSGGTANGVAYLNGSKQVTTGSALTFDGSNFKTTGSVLAGGAVPASGAGVTLAYNGSTVGYIYSYDWGASAYKSLSVAGSSVEFAAAGNTQIAFSVNGSEQMRLTSTGLGIGTSSPAYKLDVNGAINVAPGSYIRSGSNPLIASDGSTYNYQYSGTTGLVYRNQADTANLMTLTNSGNLGLGVTPSGWSGIKAFQIGTAASFSGGSGFNDAFMASNAYYNGTNWIYVNSNQAYYTSIGGSAAARWYTAPSGTAGNAISFTQAMTLDASGNLGIGTSSPSYKLAISGMATTYPTSASIGLYDTVAGVPASRNWLIGNVAAGNYGELNFAVSSAAGGAPTNSKMTLDSSGNLGLGVTPSAWGWKALQVGSFGGFFATNSAAYASYLGNNCYYDGSNWRYLASSGAVHYELAGGDRAHKWYTAPSGTAGNAISFTQAMTLTAGGTLLIGQSAGSMSVQGILLEPYGTGRFVTNNGGDNVCMYLNRIASDGIIEIFQRNSTTVGSISVTTTATTYNTSSDQRLKTDLGVAASTDVIDNTVIHDFEWKADGSKSRGVFAQEAHVVKPEAVSVGTDELNEDGLPAHPWGVDYSKYVPDLIVYCKELNKTIESLTARITTLEAK